MAGLAEYMNPGEAAVFLKKNAELTGSSEFAVVKNLDYIFSPVEIYPLAPRSKAPLKKISAVAMDMDGTSTTTEPLALNSLEYMVRRFTGRMDREEWRGLDEEKDYPYIIGNSNFRHTEFLVRRYERNIKPDALRDAFIETVLWTLSNMDDKGRRKDVTQNAVNCGLGAMLEDADFLRIIESRTISDSNISSHAKPFIKKYGRRFHTSNFNEEVAASLDIYYTRYHSIMKRIEKGEGDTLSKELLGSASRHLVEPMPGFAVYIALIKGMLDDDTAKRLFPVLKEALFANHQTGHIPEEAQSRKSAFLALAKRFHKEPVKTALVTASIFYEAHVCMKEIMRVASLEIENWEIPDSKKKEILKTFSDYRNVYEGFVTATDSSEARLKPHRDLYSIALYQMSISRSDYPFCIVLEDTEPGIISARAAGIGFACALPNHDTRKQDYSAACAVVHGGLPEMIIFHDAFLKT